jgi:hypothetical protein
VKKIFSLHNDAETCCTMSLFAPVAEQQAITVTKFNFIRQFLSRLNVASNFIHNEDFCAHWTRYGCSIQSAEDFAKITLDSLVQLEYLSEWKLSTRSDRIEFLRTLLRLIERTPSQRATEAWVRACIDMQKHEEFKKQGLLSFFHTVYKERFVNMVGAFIPVQLIVCT